MKVIDSTNIQTLSIKVSEKINKKNVFDFIKTNLMNSDVVITSNTYYYFTFMKPYLSYELIVFDKIDDQCTLEPFIFTSYYEKNSTKSIDLFLTNSYFVLYENKNLLLYKNITNISSEDIESFIYQTYKVQIDNTYTFDNDKIKKIKEDYLKNNSLSNKLKFYSINQNNSFNIFLSFVLVVSTVFGYMIYNKLSVSIVVQDDSNYLQVIQDKYQKLKEIYKNNDKKPIDNMVEFFKYLKLNHIRIDSIRYKDKKIQTTLFHKNKKKLFDTLAIYTQNISIKSVIYDQYEEDYKMEISIEL